MSEARRPRVVVIAGPNGAGKSSAADELLRDVGIETFVNADVIAALLSPGDPRSAAIEAGRRMLRQLSDLTTARRDFAFESTLSGRAFQRTFVSLAAEGYDIELHYFWLATPAMAIERVRRRVELGGHDIPEPDIRRRFERSVENFYWIYRPLASRWHVHAGGETGATRRIAEGGGAAVHIVRDSAAWSELLRQAGGDPMTDKPGKVRETVVRDRIDEALLAADRAVILRHRAGRVPLVLWRDGKIVEVDAETVELPEIPSANIR